MPISRTIGPSRPGPSRSDMDEHWTEVGGVTTLVLGGYDTVGARIVGRLRANGEVVFAAGRDLTRADRRR